MEQFDTGVLNNHRASSETQGTVYVGGTLTSNGYTVAPGSINGSPTNATLDGFTAGLIVGGDVTGGNVNMNGGNVVIGGILFAGLNNNGGGKIEQGVGGIPVDQVADTLRQASGYYSSLAPGGAVFNNPDQNSRKITADGAGADGVAVVNIDASLLSSGTFLGVDNGDGITTIVNVSGLNPTIGINANQTVGNILFNFWEAETLGINSAFNMSILAPFADVTLSGSMFGTLVAGNLTQNGEIRVLAFEGSLPAGAAAVPLPASALLLFSGGAAMLAIRRRRTS